MIFPADSADVLVVGAGPAGLAAAAAAAETGASVALVDASARPGGQFWRSGATPDPHLHRGWDTFQRLQDRMRAAGVRLFMEHSVQTIVPAAGGWSLSCAVGAEPRLASELLTVQGRRLVLASGAYDRQLPFPGWDLPGVLTAGGAQALLKGHGVVAGQRVVVAGTGPFLLPVATGLSAAGAKVAAVVEANSPAGFLSRPRAVLGAAGKLHEAARYAARLVMTRTPYRRRHAVLRALGTDCVEAVEIARLDRDGRPVPGSSHVVACDVLAVGWGFTPQLELHMQLGCATALGADGGLVVDVDAAQQTSVDGVWAAGESTGVGGADLAMVEGSIAGLAAAGRPAPSRLTARRKALQAFAAAMHAVHPVPCFLLDKLPDDVLACRCEEVPARAVRDAVHEWGATDARSVKLFARPGMGWCQGRVCGVGIAGLTARACEREVTEDDLRAFAERPFAVPLPLGLLAEPPDH